MNKTDFDVLDNSLTLRNLSLEQRKSVARLMELAIEEALQNRQSFQQSVHLTALRRVLAVSIFINVILLAVVLVIIVGR
ncbi:hypothetical protein FBQ81_03350 [Chloroflexi bacterium CFX6]|nr:hypothetical protein [Chloroflexi bacterium CFX6]